MDPHQEGRAQPCGSKIYSRSIKALEAHEMLLKAQCVTFRDTIKMCFIDTILLCIEICTSKNYKLTDYLNTSVKSSSTCENVTKFTDLFSDLKWG